MAKMASVVRVGREVAGSRVGFLEVDGEEFPWYVGRVIDVHVDLDAAPSVTFTILADRVEVVNDMGPTPENLRPVRPTPENLRGDDVATAVSHGSH